MRFVLVPHLTDGYDNVERVADACALEHTEPPSRELAERVREQFRRRGLTVY